MKFLIEFLTGAAMLVGVILWLRWNKNRTKKAIAAYYARKRKEYAWLDKWLNGQKFDVVQLRANEESGVSNLITIIVLGVVFLIALFIGKAVLFIALPAITLGIIELIAWRTSKNPGNYTNGFNYGLSLECPSCHCPHAWVMTEKEKIWDSKVINTTTQSGYQKNFTFNVYEKKTSTDESITFSGRSYSSFKCLDCGHHIERQEYEESETFNNYNPGDLESWHKFYNPPMPAWQIPESVIKEDKEKKKRERAAEGEVFNEQAKESEKATEDGKDNFDFVESFEILKNASEKGNIESMKKLAIRYLIGLGCEKDESQAIRWIKKADGKQSHFPRVAYEYGKEADNNKNYMLAFPLFQKAMELGHAGAIYELGLMYKFGNGVQKDFEKAAELLEKAANGDNLDIETRRAQFWLGNMYRNGECGPADNEKARYWYKKAAALGEASAQKVLKDMK